MKAERLWFIYIEYADKDKSLFVGYFKKRWKAAKKLRDELAKIDPSELIISAAVFEEYNAK
jgi:hypothetical protein